MLKKILAMIASVAMVGVMFSGCSCSKKNKKSQEVNKEEKKAEAAVEGSTGFESAADDKNKTSEVAKNDTKDNKKVKDDFDLDLDEEKKDKKSEKNVRSKSAPKKSVKGQNKNNVKNVVTAKKEKPNKDVKKSEDKQMSEEDLKKMAAFFKGIKEGQKDAKKESANQGTATPTEQKQEAAKQGAVTHAVGEQKKANEKVEKPQQENANQEASKPVEPKKN